MTCIFDSLSTTANTNEEYRAVVEKRIRFFGLLILAGILTGAAAIINEYFTLFPADSWINGLYSGIGTGFVVAGLIKIMQLKKLLKDDSRLKEARLNSQDERNQLIAAKSIQAAADFVLIISYAAMIITSFYSRIVFYCFWFVAMLFMFSYLFFTKYYSRKL